MGMTLPYIVSHIHWTMLEKKKKQGMQMLLTEVQVRQYWRFSWRFSTPAILFALLVFSWWQNFFSDFTNSGLYFTRVGFVGWFSVIITQEWVWSHLLPGPALSYLGSGAKIHITCTHQEEIILNQISTLCYRVICLNPGDGISDHWLHSGGSAHFWSHRGDWKNQD